MFFFSCLIARHRRPEPPKDPVINGTLFSPDTSLSRQRQPALNNPPLSNRARITRTRMGREWSRHRVVMVGSDTRSHEISDMASLSVASSVSTNIIAFSYLSVDPACQETDVPNASRLQGRAPRPRLRRQRPFLWRTSDKSHLRQIRKLGSGAEGECYLMEDEPANKSVVVKRMKRPNMVSRFRRDFFSRATLMT